MSADREVLQRTDNKHLFKTVCKSKCCTFCAWALPKERTKSRARRLSVSKSSQIKLCERCFLCHSIVLCPKCSKCTKCCLKSACEGQTSTILENLVGLGCRSESSPNAERGLHPPLSDPAKPHMISHSHKLLCQSSQEQLPVRGITSVYRQKCSGTSQTQNFSELLQSAIFSPKTKQQVETYLKSEQSEAFPQDGKIQNGDTGNHQDIPSPRRMGHLNRLQGRLFPYTNSGTVQEISEISCSGADVSVQGPAFWSVHSTLGVHCSSKRGEIDGHAPKYKDPPVPRRLVGESHIPPGLFPAYSGSSEICQNLGWLVNLDKSELEPKQIFDFVGYQFDLKMGQVRPKPDRWQNLQEKVLQILSLPACPAVHVPDRYVDCHEKQVHLGRLHMRRVGRSHRRTHCKRVLVPTRKQATESDRQHYCSVLHKQGRGYEVKPTLRPIMENLDLVHQTSGNSQSPTHPRPTECGNRQAIPTRPDHPNRMVPSSRGFFRPYATGGTGPT